MDVRILGPLHVMTDEGSVALRGAKRRALVARLAIDAGRVVALDRIVEDLWGDGAGRSAAGTVQTYVSQLRKQLGAGAVVTTPPGYVLDLPPDALDAGRFEAALARGDVDAALAEWSGDALTEFASEPWAQAEAARLDALRLGALEIRAQRWLDDGRFAEVVADLEGLVRLHPLRERLWALLIRALYGAGRQADALAAYQRLRRALVEELGIDPSPELVELEQAVLQQRVPAVRSAAPLPSGVVTFLLTDIEGSTAMWDDDPTGMEKLVAEHEVHVEREVARAGGFVLKRRGEGDATLSVFARASDALAAARALQTALALPTRVALHTGEAHERQGDYFGPAVNRAARLRGLATGGQLLLSGVTADLVRDRLPDDVALSDRGFVELRGLRRDEQIFEVVSGKDGNDDPARSVSVPLAAPLVDRDRPFFGRDSELVALRAALRREGRHVVLVSGEPGIGKTALASTAAREVHTHGTTVLIGRCDDAVGAPYQPWAEAVRHLLGAVGRARFVAWAGPGAVELGRLVPELGAPVGEGDEHRLFESIDLLLSAAAATRPLVLVLDDLHWADASTLALLRHVARSSRGGTIAIVGTYRETELARTHPLADALVDLRRDIEPTRIALDGLDADATTALVHAMCSDLDAAPIFAETDGNPFFVIEVVRHLCDAAPGSAVPEGVREVVGRRLSRLSDATNEALGVASVIGREFDDALLAAVADTEADALDRSLEHAVRAGLVEEVGFGRHQFSHAIIRQTLYDELSTNRRVKLHWRIADAMAAGPAADVAAVAHHRVEGVLAGDVLVAVDACIAAGGAASDAVAVPVALAWYERALALLDGGSDDPERRYEALLGGTVACSLLWLEDAVDWGTRAVDLADEHGWRDRIAPAAIAAGVGARATGLFERALAATEGEVSLERLAVLAGHVYWSCYTDGYSALARRATGELETLATEIGPPWRDSMLRTTMANVHLGDGDVAGMEHANEQFRRGSLPPPRTLTEAVSARWQSATVTTLDATIAVRRGDRAAHEAATRASVELAQSLPSGMTRHLEPVWRAGLALGDGRLDEAEELSLEATRVSEGTQWANSGSVTWILAQLERGNLETAFGFLAGGSDIVTDRLSAPWRAHLHAELGEFDEARRCFDELSVDGFDSIPIPVRSLAWRALADVCAVLDDGDRAALLEPVVHPYTGQLLCLAWGMAPLGAADRAIGQLVAAQGRFDEAVECYEQALALEDGFPAPALAARTKYWFARALIARDGDGDRDRAERLLAECIGFTDATGMQRLCEQARTLFAKCTRVPLPAPLESDRPFVGRNPERSTLDGALGARRLVLVAGEPGIGKTALVSASARDAQADGATVLFGRCDDGVGAPYQPWAEAIQRYRDTVSPARFAIEAGDGGPHLARLLGDQVAMSPDVASDTGRYQLFEAVDRLLSTAATSVPVVIVLDDLHWADASTLLLLRHVARSSRGGALTIVGTYRETELARTHPLADALADLRRDGNLERIGLTGLGLDATAELVSALGGHDAAAVFQRTEGNPFFVTEVVQHLAEAGDDAQLPEGVREVVGRRLSRLPDATNDAVRVAAVIGAEVDLAVLDAVVETPTLDACERAAHAGVLREVAPGRFAFTHALIRQTLVAELSMTRRVQLHCRVADVLADLYPDAIAAIAFHRVEGLLAGHASVVVAACLAAGEAAADAYAWDEALGHFYKGLELLDAGADDSAQRYRAHIGVARCHVASLRGTWTVDAATAAADIAEREGWTDRLIAAVLMGATPGSLGPSVPRQLELIERGLRAVTDGDDTTLCRLLGTKISLLLNSSATDGLPALMAEAEALEATTGVSLAFIRGHLLFGSADVEAWEASIREWSSVALLDSWRLVGEEVGWVTLALVKGGRTEFDDAARAVVDAAVRTGSQYHAQMAPIIDGMLASVEGRFEDALAAIRQWRTMDIDNSYALASAGQRRFVDEQRGRSGDWLPRVRGFLDAFPVTPARSTLALLEARAGNPDDAMTQLDELSADGFERVQLEWTRPSIWAELSETCALLGDVERATLLEPFVRPYSGLFLVGGLCVVLHGAADRALGQLLATQRRLDEAIEYYERGIAFEEAFGAPVCAARTRYWCARALVDRRTDGDADRARTLLDECIGFTSRTGMADLEAEARAVLKAR